MKADIPEARTVVNFKDIVEFLYRLKNNREAVQGRMSQHLRAFFYLMNFSNLGPLKYNINEMTVEEIDDWKYTITNDLQSDDWREVRMQSKNLNVRLGTKDYQGDSSPFYNSLEKGNGGTI